MLKPGLSWKSIALLFVAVLALYILGFFGLEHQRIRRGPWTLRFVSDTNTHPLIQITQPALRITNVEVRFPNTPGAPATNALVQFVAGQEPPFPVPFGECVFMDPLFLPGTVTLQVFGHRIELLPKSLRIDGTNHEWQSGLRFELDAAP